ncbi:MAG: glycosyltransferase [Burkholderiales bacterium]|nr:glycosyltransferase [Burkholderiales bacterium]
MMAWLAGARGRLRARAVGLVRRLARALPVSHATKQRIKVRLVASPLGAPLLRWLTPGADREAGAGAASTLDKEAVRAEAEASLTAFLAGAERLRVPMAPGDPVVSVIVVLYNQAGLSLHCLRALCAVQGLPFELLLVDNASTDRMPELLARLEGAQVLRQRDNLGFVRAVNLAAAHARGEHLLLLNNDAVVQPDTLRAAVDCLAAHPGAAAVGGPILLWDGRLQEAGSIVWRDGSCSGYGRGDDPQAPPYGFVRAVDYCSGAFLMLRRRCFEQLGGLDEAYAPAYYEETDLCARLWQAGHAVLYDPRVRVRHFEFASVQAPAQALALQAEHRQLFAARHPRWLAAQVAFTPGDARCLLQARQRLPAGAQRVLYLDDRVPDPALGQGYPRAAALLQALASQGDVVTLLPLLRPHEPVAGWRSRVPMTVEVMTGVGLAGLAAFLAARAGHYQTIVVSRPHNLQVVAALRQQHPAWFQGSRLVYDAEALAALRDIEQARVLGRPMSEAAQRQRVEAELALANTADTVVTVSEAEAAHFRAAGRPDVRVLGHPLRPAPLPTPFEARQGFLFVGAMMSDDSPNADSLRWFVHAVWPRIVQALGPEALLDIVGPNEAPTVQALASGSVRLHGRVDALAPWLAGARVFVVPTRFAAGLPHKAHEAAAAGLPLVATPLIATQLGWQHCLPAAPDAAAFAEACVRLHTDAQRWQAQRAVQLAAVQRDCDPQQFTTIAVGLLRPATALAAPAAARA